MRRPVDRAAAGCNDHHLGDEYLASVGDETEAPIGLARKRIDPLAEALGSSQMPWEKHLDLRVHKGFQLAGTRMRVFADWRNPLDIENTNSIYLETGTAFNDAYRRQIIETHMGDQNMDGDANIDDINILTDFPPTGNALNQYSLLQAERRFAIGEPDGIFTVEEQERAFGAYFDLVAGPQYFVESDQSLRLGVEVVF